MPFVRIVAALSPRYGQVGWVERAPLVSPIVIDVHADALRVGRQLDPVVQVNILLRGGIASVVVEGGVADHIVPGPDVSEGLPVVDAAQADDAVKFGEGALETFCAQARFAFVAALDGQDIVDELSARGAVAFGADQRLVAALPKLFED